MKNLQSRTSLHLPTQKFMTFEQINDLLRIGEHLEEKIAVFERSDARGVHFRDMEFTNFNRAALYMRHVASIELTENYESLVG